MRSPDELFSAIRKLKEMQEQDPLGTNTPGWPPGQLSCAEWTLIWVLELDDSDLFDVVKA